MPDFIKFLVVGAIAAVANIILRIILNYVVSYEMSIIVAYFIAMTIAFVLNKAFVFRSQQSYRSEYIRFFLVNIIAVMIVWLVSIGLARLLFPAIGFTWHAETIAHVIGVMSPVVFSYFGHKHFSFGKATQG